MVLNGWKEIANYMRRGVRTVQRWERYGLPIYRPSKEQASVIARSEDLDSWLVAGGKRSDTLPADAIALSERIKALERENEELRQELTRVKSTNGKDSAAAHPRTQVQAA